MLRSCSHNCWPELPFQHLPYMCLGVCLGMHSNGGQHAFPQGQKGEVALCYESSNCSNTRNSGLFIALSCPGFGVLGTSWKSQYKPGSSSGSGAVWWWECCNKIWIFHPSFLPCERRGWTPRKCGCVNSEMGKRCLKSACSLSFLEENRHIL